MVENRPIVLAEDEGDISPDPLGRPRTVKASADMTDGAYTLTMSSRLPGPVAPAHVHREHVEAFYVLNGELTFDLGGQPTVAPAGTFVLVPRGVSHAFDVTGQNEASYLCIFSPPPTEAERRSLKQQLSGQDGE
jgi:quercetin dioxygenase-like cupin family protein